MTKDQKIIRAKVGLLELAKQLGNVSQACKMMDYSRDSFCRFKELYETGGELALQELTRRKLLANRTPPQIEAIIIEPTLEYPAYGQTRIANEMRKLGHSVSPSGVRGVWQRHDLETMKKRLRRWRRRSPNTASCSPRANWRRWKRPGWTRGRMVSSRVNARAIAAARTPSMSAT